MPTSPPKYSVLIPTRERAATLKFALRTLTQQTHQGFEVVVSDNCSKDETRQVVEQAADPRVKYVKTDARVSMSENWEFGLKHCQGDWISVMGDDDGFLPGCFERLDDVLSEHVAEALTFNYCGYLWPNPPDADGSLAVPVASGCEIIDSRIALDAVMDGKARYATLPLVYNGNFVARCAIERATPADGRFFRSCNPDVYSAIALSCAVRSYVRCRQPIGIAGSSKFSIGASHFSKADRSKGAKKAFDEYAGESNLPFHPRVPMGPDGGYPRSIQALVLESYYQAREVFKWLPEPDPEKQVALAMSSSGGHDELVRGWCQAYCEQSEIDLARSIEHQKWATATARFHKQRARWMKYTDTRRFSSRQLPIDDVYQASIAAENVLKETNSRPRVLVEQIIRKLHKSRFAG